MVNGGGGVYVAGHNDGEDNADCGGDDDLMICCFFCNPRIR